MKRFLVLASLLLSTYSAHATVVAEDTAEHTINFTFGRPTADVWLCEIELSGSWDTNTGDNSSLDTMTFPNGDRITGKWRAGNSSRIFTRETAPSSSILHLGSSNYGSRVIARFCHDFQVPGGSPGGQIDSFYKIITPANWSYFTNSQIMMAVGGTCFGGLLQGGTGWLPLTSNTITDFTWLASLPFAEGQPMESTAADPNCFTYFDLSENSENLRTPGETAGNITIGLKDVINFN